jgi:cytochrome c2
MKKGILLVLSLGLPLLVAAVLATPSRAADAKPTGPEMFVNFKCNTCHSIQSQNIESKTQSEKMKGPDLSDVGNKHDAKWIDGWLQHTEKKDDKLHKGQFKGTDAERADLIAWLVTLKKPA